MKTRVISSLVGLGILAVVVVFLDTLLLNAAIALISFIGLYELLRATGVTKHPSLAVLSMLMAPIISFARVRQLSHLLPEVAFVLILLLFLTLLRHHKTMRIEQVAMAFFFGAFLPLFFSCAVHLRDDFGPRVGGFYLITALGAAWLTDTGAYFCGRAFGKHKLAPVVSPKKTVEGSVGGAIVCTVCMLLLALAYSLLMHHLGYPVEINYPLLLALTPLFSVMGMLGDLSASVIKRAFGVKDYGHIMPGHGGILDRFDSVLFTLPTVYIFVQHLPFVFHLGA